MPENAGPETAPPAPDDSSLGGTEPSAADPAPPDGHAENLDAGVAWRRLRRALTASPTRGQWVVAVLCALLGFGVALQVRTVGADPTLANSRPEDLVRLLDALDERGQRLDSQIRDLERTRAELTGARDQEEAAEAARAERARDLGVLAGTLPASGPGVRLRFEGPVDAALMIDAVQELRDAGAEAQQIDEVRVVASTSVVDAGAPGELVIDGETVKAPFVMVAIGDPATMASALRIPGGVADRAAAEGVALTITESPEVVVDAVRPLPDR
jgi:uncharacterized protein YlxW (UPF0749 family)